MKAKKILITLLAIILSIATVFTVVFFAREDTEKQSQKETESITNVSSETESELITVDNIESSTSSTDEEKFIKPDETKADELLKNNNSKSQVSSSASSETETKTESKVDSKKNKKEQQQTFEESQKELETKAEEYLKKNNIDPKTAGETGESCINCGKKIWNPDKYGLNIPGMPDDYENSGYCLGTCGISIE